MTAHVSPLALSAAQYQRAKASLINDHGIAEDDPDLAELLEGETDLPDMLASMIRHCQELDAHAEALGAMKAQIAERQSGKRARSSKYRAIVLSFMDANGIKKLERPDFSAAPRRNRGGVIYAADFDAGKLPEPLRRTKHEPDAKAIREALEAGQDVPGAVLGNPSRSLAIR